MSEAITVDGIHYRVETAHFDSVVRVFHANGERDEVACAEYDSMAEAVYYSYRTLEDGKVDEGASADLYSKTPVELAEWLAATHPINF